MENFNRDKTIDLLKHLYSNNLLYMVIGSLVTSDNETKDSKLYALNITNKFIDCIDDALGYVDDFEKIRDLLFQTQSILECEINNEFV